MKKPKITHSFVFFCANNDRKRSCTCSRLLETYKGIPRNPFVNSGAIVICDILSSNYKNAREEFFLRDLNGLHDLTYSNKIADSEKATGYRNVALCNFIKSFGNIKNEPVDVLDF